ncbi:hypothetical protein PF007_g26309 [Phytophthora fragariae]|uniref:GST N-terminal domain-containing protein n=1 Tax=Phytophthora fragariae TaxID=53985 RepID=A0A6A3R2D0_9STRA|nr:hypothetical protein PF009_g27030 [Phytophthora fragariae]KAE9072076.1 hypothetical protein PF007_g26309 [Phytophthora fragariae]KAE9087681.1 hypothetical protein PF006_g25750 [Phytophthora fragariae]KAE9179047.1 hypothetical protein PF004_g25291 [Phytophthora fragariae]
MPAVRRVGRPANKVRPVLQAHRGAPREDEADPGFHVRRRVANHPKVNGWYTLQNKLKLTYMPLPGRGEPICLALFIGGVEFEDERISREALANRKLPFNQLPVLEVDGEVIAQTNHSGALPSARRRRRSSWSCALSWPAA